jgi:hypothetical protein
VRATPVSSGELFGSREHVRRCGIPRDNTAPYPYPYPRVTLNPHSPIAAPRLLLLIARKAASTHDHRHGESTNHHPQTLLSETKARGRAAEFRTKGPDERQQECAAVSEDFAGLHAGRVTPARHEVPASETECADPGAIRLCWVIDTSVRPTVRITRKLTDSSQTGKQTRTWG